MEFPVPAVVISPRSTKYLVSPLGTTAVVEAAELFWALIKISLSDRFTEPIAQSVFKNLPSVWRPVIAVVNNEFVKPYTLILFTASADAPAGDVVEIRNVNP